MGNKETTTKFSRLKSISSIEDNYSFGLAIYLFSRVSLQLQRTEGRLLSFTVKKIFIEIGFKEV